MVILPALPRWRAMHRLLVSVGRLLHHELETLQGHVNELRVRLSLIARGAGPRRQLQLQRDLLPESRRRRQRRQQQRQALQRLMGRQRRQLLR